MFDRRAGRVPQMRSQRAIACVVAALGMTFANPLTRVALAARNMPTTLSTVRAVNVDSGRISALAVVGARGRYRLSVRAGAYLVVLSKVRANGGSTDRVDRLTVVRAATGDRVGRAAAARPVVTIGKVTLGPAKGAPGRNRNVDALVLRDLYQPLTNSGIAFVDLNGQVVAASKREQQLYEDGRSATPVSYNPLQPTYEIAGSGIQLRNGRVTMTLDLKNLVTGQVVATKTVTGKGRTLSQLEGLFGELSSEFAGEASGVIEQSPTGGAVTVDLDVTFLHEGTGSGTVTSSPPGRTLSKTDDAIYQFKVANGTTVSLLAKPDAGSYFVGWESGSTCGATEFQSSDPEYSCTVSDPGDGSFPIRPGANFATCPMPGTFVNDPNESVCRGVTVIHN
jgi:hypothetical protein